MWTSRLFWKLFIVYGGINFALAAMFPLLLTNWQESLLIDQVQRRLDGMAIVLRSEVEDDLKLGSYDRLNSLAKRLREKPMSA